MSDGTADRHGPGGARDRRAAKAAAELLERVSRGPYSRSFSHGLNPSQWAALRFFAQANPSARTMTRFAHAHLVTPSTAAQTVAALVRKGYLVRTPLPEDRRSTRLDATGAGLDLLRDDPLNDTIEAIARLPERLRRALTDGLEALSRTALERPPRDPGTDDSEEAALPLLGRQAVDERRQSASTVARSSLGRKGL